MKFKQSADSVEELIAIRPGAECIQAANALQAIPINEFISMSPGSSNAYLLHNASGRIVINTGMGFESHTHRRLFDQVSSAYTKYIILTQGHVDHVGGVATFREQDTLVVAQENNQACQADDARIGVVRIQQSYIWFSHIIDQAVKAAEENPANVTQDIPTPDLVFRDTHELDLGELRVELISTPGGETLDSLIAWLPQHRILFSGNLFGALFPHFPNFNTVRGDKYRMPEKYLSSLDTARSLGPEVLITGHGEPVYGSSLIRECLDRLEASVEYVMKKTLDGMNQGIDIFTLSKQIVLPEELTVGQGYGKVDWAVRTIWEAYMGWFHRMSTTELYSHHHRDIYEHILLAAGADGLLERAEQCLKQGEYLSSIQLAEIVLSKEESVRAKKISIEAHTALLENESENFWLRGWLQHQLQTLTSSPN